MTHWTYQPTIDAQGDLQQGDLIFPTDGLRDVLKDVHSHFLDPKYSRFMVISQTCDLVRRGSASEPKAQYINIAVVRPLEQILLRVIDSACNSLGEGVYAKGSKNEANQLMSRILNQNESQLGLFYLHPDDSVGIYYAEVAMLRVSIALRSMHYPTLIEARSGRLEEAFQHKLAWMVGNIYSRIGTKDWTENKEDKKTVDKLLKELLREKSIEGKFPFWVPDFAVAKAKENGIDISSFSTEELEAFVADARPKPLNEQLAIAVKDICGEAGLGVSDSDLDTLCRLVKTSPKIKSILKMPSPTA